MSHLINTLVNDLSYRKQASNVFLYIFLTYSILEILFVSVWSSLEVSGVYSMPPRLRVALVSLLIYDYIYSHFQRLSWLWMIIGLTARFSLVLALQEALTILPFSSEYVLPCYCLYGVVRLVMILVQSKLSSLLKFAIIVVSMMACSLLATFKGSIGTHSNMQDKLIKSILSFVLALGDRKSVV